MCTVFQEINNIYYVLYRIQVIELLVVLGFIANGNLLQQHFIMLHVAPILSHFGLMCASVGLVTGNGLFQFNCSYFGSWIYCPFPSEMYICYMST